MRPQTYQLGEWLVDCVSCTLRHRQQDLHVTVEPRAMDVLAALCAHADKILSAQDLLKLCWDGVIVGENRVHNVVAQLRRALGDSGNGTRYIENIRKRGYRLVPAVRNLSSGGTEFLDGAWSQKTPFVGLDSFDENHASVFFGRDAALLELQTALAAQLEAQRAFLLLLGPSGSGKTSLVQAGLIPALKTENAFVRLKGSAVLDLSDIGELPPLIAVGGALLDIEIDGRLLLRDQSGERIAGLLSESRDEAWSGLFAEAALEDAAGKVLLFIDRLETIFNSPVIDEGQRRVFLDGLDHLAQSGTVIVVAACRNDFYPDVAADEVLMKVKASGGHIDLAPPTRAEIAQMIRLPAHVAGLTFGIDMGTKERLDDILCDRTAESPDALPLLQYALQELYLQRSPNRELTMTAYRQLGGLEGAIGKRAEETLVKLSENAQASLRRILSLIVTVGPGDESVRCRRMPWSALAAEEERALVRTLVQQRLFVSLVYDGEPVFGVAHEAMVRRWPRAARWVADHRHALNTRSRLEVAARRWMAESRRADLLLPRGRLLEEARDLSDRSEIPLGQMVATFIEASIDRARLAERRRFGVLVAFGLIALAAGALGLLASQAEHIAERRTRQAQDLMNFMVGDLADKLRPIGRLDLLSGIGEKALGYFAASQPASLSPTERHQEGRALATIAEVARSRGDSKAARDALLLAKSLIEANLSEGLESAELLKDIGADAFGLGQIDFDQGRLDEAEGHLQDYRRYAERLMQLRPDDVDAWIEVSYAGSSLGAVASARGDNVVAAAAFEKSIALKRRALAQRPDDHNLRAELANSLSWLGTAREAQGELRQALDLFEQERSELASLLRTAPSEDKWTYRLIASIHRHAQLLDVLGHAAEAERELQANQVLAADLVSDDPSNLIWQRALLNSDTLLAWIEARLGRTDKALALQNSTALQLAKLADIDRDNTTWTLLEAVNVLFTGETLFLQGHFPEARDHTEQALARLRSMSPQSSNKVDVDQRIAGGLLQLGRIDKALGASSRAVSECNEAIDVLKPLLDVKALDYRVQELWVGGHICAGLNEEVATSLSWLENIGFHHYTYWPHPAEAQNGEEHE